MARPERIRTSDPQIRSLVLYSFGHGAAEMVFGTKRFSAGIAFAIKCGAAKQSCLRPGAAS